MSGTVYYEEGLQGNIIWLLSQPYTIVVLLFLVTWFKIYPPYGIKKKIALDPDTWIPFPLIEIEKISHDVRRFRFALQSTKHTLGLPIGQHISLKYVDENDKEVQRSYTPITSDDEKGYVDFVIKVYNKGVHPKFPEGGKMSQYLDNMKLEQTMLMKGPKGHLTYKGCGNFSIAHRPTDVREYTKRNIGMIAGGTGITPMLQIIRAVLKNPADKTNLWLIFANQSEDDILLRKELEEIKSSRFHLWYTVDRPPAKWDYSTGFINAAMCKDHLPPPSADTFLFVCGPPPMIKFACEPAFTEIGFQSSDWFAF